MENPYGIIFHIKNIVLIKLVLACILDPNTSYTVKKSTFYKYLRIFCVIQSYLQQKHSSPKIMWNLFHIAQFTQLIGF